jgi:hypothetical protein
MGRPRRNVFAVSSDQHYIVIWDLQWRVIDCLRPRPGTDLRAALTDAILRLERDGWVQQSTADFGFAFVTRSKERRLVMITARDPLDRSAQSFSPFDQEPR